MKNLLLLILLITVTKFGFTEGSAPIINKLSVAVELQGEQGVEQTIVRAVVNQKKLRYTYSIIKGKARIKKVKDFAILSNIQSESVTIKLKVTNKEKKSAEKTVTYSVAQVNKSEIYRDKDAWTQSVTGILKKNPAFKFQTRNDKLAMVLIIGNSISMGYTPFVQKELKEKCNVYRIPTNAGSTFTGLKELNNWLADEKWDVIHFNFGLHDLKKLLNNKLDLKGEQVATPTVYKKNLEIFVRRLQKQTKAKLIFATTSTVPKGSEGRVAGDEIVYNKIALEIMKKYNIEIDDQYSLTKEHPKDQLPKNVHFKASGKKRQAQQVAKKILEALEK